MMKRALSHPIVWMVLLIVLCLNIKENFPFSNFPMYSQQKDQTDYYYLKDADGVPLATLDVTRLSTTKIKKMMGRELGRIASENKIPRGDLPLKFREEAAAEVLQRIRKMGLFAPNSGKKQPLANPVTLVWVNVLLAENGIVKATKDLTKG